jgi:hypothetical protein
MKIQPNQHPENAGVVYPTTTPYQLTVQHVGQLIAVILTAPSTLLLPDKDTLMDGAKIRIVISTDFTVTIDASSSGASMKLWDRTPTYQDAAQVISYEGSGRAKGTYIEILFYGGSFYVLSGQPYLADLIS